ncbi:MULTISPECIES: maltose/glucose-specific PTS transporter subunit IIBC [Bacillaceae]|uniref:PTS maltose transporter subunit IICB n=1 Tax=Gottfriedia luciferensis TaxID=178774 RepID=A0ABX2ZJU8_9BACI|nr:MULTISPECIES: maltose/glucose-specific PTS transporter subunit IIBC [Bacillaceae]ODG89953.1 PTS maltose transporter subunit IICB [Gottfriedia luciferensis]PGZ91268.1 PTS maltose transporter subunit IICB [Bacillus sp. AFS029533]SFD13166.1 PTS system, maltose and glucose-specific IIC component [Bacillus sp. UNCCL81]
MAKKKSVKSQLWEFFQGLGKTFMVPVALLAFMGLILGIGSSFTSPTTIETFPFLGNSVLQVIFSFMSTIGGFAFSYLPVLFAMAIPFGLVRYEKGVAAFSGFVGYVIMHLSINFYLTETNQLVAVDKMRQAGQGMVMGIQTIEMGVLGGIIAGIIVYLLHNRFYSIKLPDAFAFFGGARFVPIITTLALSVVGIIIPMIWPIFAIAITGIGSLIQKSGVFGPFLFGAGERLLLPFGLHHILVAMIRFTEAGGTEVVNGQTVSGALNIFYAQLKAGAPISPSATAFLSQGKMPTFMFGLPAVALAIYHTARPENRNKIKGLLISGVIATFVTGITEPIEFLFLFVSPPLYFIHVILTGLGFMVMALLHLTIGNTDGGILDFIIFGVLQGVKTKWYLVPVIGAIWFTVYYSVFRYAILKFNLKTPGREEKIDDQQGEEPLVKGTNAQALKILTALGGKENIQSLDNCITRLRLVVDNMNIVNEKVLKDCGALGVVKLDEHNLQVVIGPQVGILKTQLEKLSS